MLMRETMMKLIDLQERSYALLRWLNEAMRRQVFRFDRLHEAMSLGDAARAWIERHHDCLPEAVRPDREDLDAFANLFASYLATSFEQVDRLTVPAATCGCYFCTQVVNVAHLRVRRPDAKANRAAHKLKLLALQRLSDELTLPTVSLDLEGFIQMRGELAQDIAWVTYGYELVRRTEFASQGEGVLVLWRQIAWDGDRPKRNFKLTAECFIDAEARVSAALREMFGVGD